MKSFAEQKREILARAQRYRIELGQHLGTVEPGIVWAEAGYSAACRFRWALWVAGLVGLYRMARGRPSPKVAPATPPAPVPKPGRLDWWLGALAAGWRIGKFAAPIASELFAGRSSSRR